MHQFWPIIFSFLLKLYISTPTIYALPDVIRIGGLFDEDAEINEYAFKYSIDAIINANGYDADDFKGVSAIVPFGDEYPASKKLCEFINEGVTGVIGPISQDTSSFVQSLCDEKEIPLIQSIWNQNNKSRTFVNLYPHPESTSTAILDIIKHYQWTSFTILYQSAQWLPRVANLLKLYDSKGYTVTVRQISLGINNNYRPVLKRVKSAGDRSIIIDCSVEILPEVLKQALQVGLLTDKHQFIVTNLDFHTIDVTPFQYVETNITGIRIVDTNDKLVQEISAYWLKRFEESIEKELLHGVPENLNKTEFKRRDYIRNGLSVAGMKTSTAMIYDGILLYVEALKQLEGIEDIEPENLSCDNNNAWKHGYSVANSMRIPILKGLTNYIKFDNEGFRTEVDLDVFELTAVGIQSIGRWNNTHFLNVARRPINIPIEEDFRNKKKKKPEASMKNVTLRVLIAISAPYGMLKAESSTLSGNDQYEGFAIELIEKLGEILGFNYTFILQEDGVYGTLNQATNQWDGMLGKIINGEADLAITDLTITSEREQAVDFTVPFMNLGISILYRKPQKQSPAFFSFMSPFSNEVWLYLGIAYFSVSICLFILGRISPDEWSNPYPCIEEPEELENQFSFRNAMWFTIGALLQQGTEIAPRSPSSRTIASIWWFFTLIMVSSYTAKLAAFLTIDTIIPEINSVADLYHAKGRVKYGAKRGGSTINFFRDADIPMYSKMYDYMIAHDNLLTSSNEEGLKMVKSMNYAFLMESTSIEYMKERNCDVRQVGVNLDDKDYGIAMKKLSKYRGHLSEAILLLTQQGELTEMKKKWWNEKRGGGQCSNTKAADSAEELDMGNVGGVFLVLLIGSLVSAIFGCIEWVCNIRKRAKYYKEPFRQELLKEFRFVIKCRGNTKIQRPMKSQSISRQSGISGNSYQSRVSLTPGRDLKFSDGLK